MMVTLLYINTIILFLVLVLSSYFFVKIFVLKDFDDKIDVRTKDLKSDNKNLLIKIEDFNNCFFDITEHIENQINRLYNYLNGTLSKTEFNRSLLLNDFNILYFTPYDGYLSVEADYCELNLFDDSQICIKNKLNNFYIAGNKSISIRGIKGLRNIRFDKKGK